jgi:hypothetical protein
MVDPRLLGSWQSDARRTMREVRCRRDIPEKHWKTWRKVFGKLRIRYTPTRGFTDFEGFLTKMRYRVVAKDANSVAIVATDDIGMDYIYHIHFERDHFWFSLGNIREYFRRVEEPCKRRSVRKRQ